jgi:hypothetical protein
MTQLQGYLAALIVLALGVGLAVFGWISHQPAAVELGGLLSGTALGWIGLKRPADKESVPPTA